MGIRPKPFAPNEWYHCYSRGIDKRTIFESPSDHERFMQLLYLTNTTSALHRSNIKEWQTEVIVDLPRTNTLVSLGAYCLMPNHFHLLIHEDNEGGISKFMQKLGTAYTMYFNLKYERSGGLLTRPFRARHISNDEYFQHVVNYIHMNPIELFEPEWTKGKTQHIHMVEKTLRNYRYSSLPDHLFHYEKTKPRALAHILSKNIFTIIREKNFKEVLADAREYHAQVTTEEELRALKSRQRLASKALP